MVNKTVKNLDPITTPNGGDIFAVRQGVDTVDKKATIGQYTDSLAPINSPNFTGNPTGPTYQATNPDVFVNSDVPVGNVVSSTKSNFRAGYLAMDNFISGDYNIAIGESALQNTTSSNNNTALGSYSLQNLTTGTRNVVIGPFAGRNIQNGFSNVVIGSFTEIGRAHV